MKNLIPIYIIYCELCNLYTVKLIRYSDYILHNTKLLNDQPYSTGMLFEYKF